MSILDLKIHQALHTLVFETLGQPEKARAFKIKALKRWGLDLLAGTKDGREAIFVAPTGRRKAGEEYEEADVKYSVKEILQDFPRNQKFYAHITMVQGTAYLVGTLSSESDTDQEILNLPAAPLIFAYLKKHKLPHLMEAVQNIGTATALVKHRGQEGKPYPYEELPNIARRFLREAKKIEKSAGFGRVALAYFGENKDGSARFRLSWLLPTIALFEHGLAEKVDKNLAAFK